MEEPLPVPKFKCWACGHEWEGKRYLWDEEHQVVTVHVGYGPTECALKSWEHIYVTWVNWEECRKVLGRYWEEKDG